MLSRHKSKPAGLIAASADLGIQCIRVSVRALVSVSLAIPCLHRIEYS